MIDDGWRGDLERFQMWSHNNWTAPNLVDWIMITSYQYIAIVNYNYKSITELNYGTQSLNTKIYENDIWIFNISCKKEM